MLEELKPNFIIISKSQVALHPSPKGIIQFIGSFIFGSFPAWAYRDLLQYLYSQGYSLILYRFPLNPFQFDHWQVSLKLMEEQSKLKPEILKTLTKEAQDIYSDSSNYLWLGHSLGCKYIILLEILSNNPIRRKQVLEKCLGVDKAEKIIKNIGSISQEFIVNQSSVFLAPEISNTVRIFKSSWRISNPLTNPNQSQTECMIAASQELFNLTGIISFNYDNIAEDDVIFLIHQLKGKPFQPYLYTELEGGHFQPLTIKIETLGKHINDFYEQLISRL
jgi:hypothetical protein